MKMLPLSRFLGLLLVVLLTTGCQKGEKKPAADGDGGHGHHHHHHDHGKTPHGGHLIELVNKKTGGEEEFHAEWKHDDKSGKVTIYILDAKFEKDYPIEAEAVTIDVTIQGKETESYQLPAVGRSEETPKGAQYELVNQVLLTALKMEKGVESILKVDIDGTAYEGKFEPHAHHDDHGHKH